MNATTRCPRVQQLFEKGHDPTFLRRMDPTASHPTQTARTASSTPIRRCHFDARARMLRNTRPAMGCASSAAAPRRSASFTACGGMRRKRGERANTLTMVHGRGVGCCELLHAEPALDMRRKPALSPQDHAELVRRRSAVPAKALALFLQPRGRRRATATATRNR